MRTIIRKIAFTTVLAALVAALAGTQPAQAAVQQGSNRVFVHEDTCPPVLPPPCK